MSLSLDQTKIKHDTRPNVGFVGLLNQGATCYLNSLIQQLYMTPELRSAIYSLTQEELGLINSEAGEDEEEEEVEKNTGIFAITKFDSSYLSEITSMGFSERLANKALQETLEHGKASVERAIEWILTQGMDMDLEEPPKEEEEKKPEENVKRRKTKKLRKIPIELQKLFAFLELVDKNAISTRYLTESFGWKGNEIVQQHDVHELNRVLFEAIERSLKKTPSENLLNKLYGGRMVNKVKCLTCGYTSERLEDFQDVPVIVKNFSSINYSLDDYVQVEKLEKDNQYFCEKCDVNRDAHRWVCFREIPPILIFSLNRFEYDLQTFNRIKNTSKFHYPLAIDMSKYSEAHLQSNGASEKGGKVQKSANELSLYEPEIIITEENVNQIYDLTTVIIHTGKSGDYGHYHAYIKDLIQEGNWDYTDALANSNQNPITITKHAEDGTPLEGFVEEDDDDIIGDSKSGNSTTQKKSAHARSASDEFKRKNDDEDKENENIFTNANNLLDHAAHPPTTASCNSSSSNTSDIDKIKNQLLTPLPKIPNKSKNTKDGKDTKNKEQGNEANKKKIKRKLMKEDLESTNREEKSWFDFNDSNIKPITVSKLRTQFGGIAECGYMLVYRKRELNDKVPKPLVPEYLKIAAEEKNRSIHAEREKKEMEFNQIRVTVYPDHYFEVDPYGIARISSSPDIVPYSILVDRRLSIKYLKETYLLLLSSSGSSPAASTLTTTELHFNPIRIINQKLNIYKTAIENNKLVKIKSTEANPDSQEASIQESEEEKNNKSIFESGYFNGIELLGWNGDSINNTHWNPNNAAISFDCKAIRLYSEQDLMSPDFLYIQDETDEKARDYHPIEIENFTFELTENTLLYDLFSKVYELTSIPLNNQLISFVVENTKLKQFPIISHVNPGDESDQEYLLNNNSFLQKPLKHFSIPRNATLIVEKISNEISTQTEKEISTQTEKEISTQTEQEISQQMESEVLESNHHSSFAEDYLNQINNMYQLEILNQTYAISTKVLVIVSKKVSLDKIKEKLIDHLHLHPLTTEEVLFRRIREGYSMDVIENEDSPISNIGIMNGTTLSLSKGDAPSKKTVSIRCKFNQLKLETSLELVKDQTIRQGKEMILSELKRQLVKHTENAENIEYAGFLYLLDLNVDDFILRHCQITGQQTRTFANEQITIRSGKIQTGQILVLYEKVSLTQNNQHPNQLIYSLKLFEYADYEHPGHFKSSFSSPVPPDFFLSSSGQRIDPASVKVFTDGAFDSSALLDESDQEDLYTVNDFTQSNPWQIFSPAYSFTSEPPDCFSKVDLGVFTISKSLSLLQWKEQLIKTLPLLAAAKSPYHVRLWSRVERILKSHHKPVGSLSSNTCIVQVLGHAEDLAANIVCLYVYVRDSSKKQFYRPVEYLFDTQNNEFTLFQCLLKDFEIPADSIFVAKYLPPTDSTNQSTPLLPITADSDSNEPQPQPQSANRIDIGEVFSTTKTVVPLVNTPIDAKYRDGDIIIIQDKRKDPNSEDDLTKPDAIKPFVIGAPVPLVAFDRPKIERREVELKIHVDTFDDEDEDEPPQKTKNLRVSA